MSTSLNLNLAAPPVPKTSTDNAEIIYSLPKSYNGKTVFDLFPEFKQDSVLRFSKLFGLGRPTSLPKIWKGSRKRKKAKNASTTVPPNVQPDLNNLMNISEENKGDDKKSVEDDVFKMLDDAFLPSVDNVNKEKDTEKKIENESTAVEKQSSITIAPVEIEDGLEFSVDDEVDFMKPFKILEEINEIKSSNSGEPEKETVEKIDTTWRYGPASFWYDKTEPTQYIITVTDKTAENKNNSKDKKKKKNENEGDMSDDEMEENADEAENKDKIPVDQPDSNDTQSIDLTNELKDLKNMISDERCLLVSTMNWEENILIDVNQNQNPAFDTENANNNSLAQVNLNQQNELINERIKYAGWIPSSEHQTLFSYQSKVFGKKVDFLKTYIDQAAATNTVSSSGSSKQQTINAAATVPVIWNSIFPNENYELFDNHWEKKIILDPENIDPVLYNPPEFYIDPNDDNLLLGIPDDTANNQADEASGAMLLSAKGKDQESNESKKDKTKIYENRTKISKSLLGRTGVIKEDQTNEIDSDSTVKTSTVITAVNDTKNFWNISNDEYYNPKVVTDQTTVSKNVSTSLVLQHTIVALELRQIFFPTYLNPYKCRNFHRNPIKRYLTGVLTNELQFFPVSSNLKKVYHMGKKIEKPLVTIFPTSTSVASNNDFNSIQSANDLTCTDNCDFILAEYSEQFPPLMMQVGMATKIRNFYKRKFAKDDGPQNLEYGELVYVNNSPFLGALKPGDFIQSIENYMFRAPIYMHKMPEQDFLLIRNRNIGYTIRGDFKGLFVVGQECPLIEVPGPNSKRANSFLKDFLQAYIFRLFHKSRDIPKRVKMEDLKKAFPTHSESSIRKRLKLVADLKRTEKTDANWWVIKEEVRLPTEDEIRSIVTPEQCCAYYSMCAAEQRLKDAGYGEKNLFASDDDDVDNIKIDDEVKNAPWHTTRAYIDAIKGKCLLQINGVADPTGRGEGFSYVRQPFKPNKQDEEQEKKEEKKKEETDLAAASPQPAVAAKRTVTGTDADLRRLHLSQAKELLASYGVPDHEIKKLKRWEIIDVVRTMSTQKAKEGSGSAVSKFARGNRYSQSDAHEKFREECQNLFDMQNRNLASEEFLSTDDDEDLDEDTDVDEMGKNLESMLQNKMISETPDNNSKSTNGAGSKANSNKPMDKSTELKNLIMSKSTVDAPSTDPKAKNTPQEVPPNMHRILKITRTYRDIETGIETTKVEIVKKPLIIDAYVKIRSTKDDEFIRTAFALDETEKEKLRKERRRLQEQLRRVKRNEAKRANDDNSPIDGVPKVRKYNKSGLPRKTKKSKLLAEAGNISALGEQNTPASLKKNKSMMQYSSADDDKSMNIAGENQDNDANQSNLLDTTASSLNNTLTGAVPGVVKKRKYIKRKKIDQANANSTPGEAGTTGLSKIEGTKLIIQKKALTLNNDENPENSDLNNSGAKPKKPRVTKKQLKSQLSSLLVVESNTENPNNDPNQSSDHLQAPKLKIINKNKQKKSSLILHIPKEKLGMSSSNNQEPGELGSTDAGSADNLTVVDQTSSPTKKAGAPGQPKRQYNKTNSLLKKQQKMMMQQQRDVQQQLEQQLKLQMSQAQFAGGSNQDQFAAAVAAASQFANLFEMQQMIALQQQMSNQGIPNTPGIPGSNSKKPSQQQPQRQNSEQNLQAKRKPSTQSAQQMDYLIKPHMKKVDRRHADPLVSYASILENILNELRDSPDAQQFILPVNSKKVPDYYNLVKNPIDLQTIRKRINDKVYKNRGSFLEDIQLLVENSALYNGSNHTITASAENLLLMCEQKLEEKKDKLLRLEKAINPLLDDNSLIALNFILNQIFEQNIMTVENSFAFLKPVNKGKYKDYYEVIKSPIDLETIKNKIHAKKYKSREEFISDFEILYNNSLTYNGLNNSYTNTAQKLLSTCKTACNSEYKDQLKHLEDMAIQDNNHDDDNSQSGFSSNRIQSSTSVDVTMDNENPNENETFEPGQANLPKPMMSLSKKLKSLNKKITTNQNNRLNSTPKQTGTRPSSSGSFEQKNRQLFFPNKHHKDSPKSGSDADVFVDVESIDEKGVFHSKNNQDVEEGDFGVYNDSGPNAYDEDF